MKIEIKVLNAMRFTKLFIAASRWISKYSDVMNDLNVFPVPDGDTGTNISMTLQAVENDLIKLDHEPNMKEFVDLVSESIILGAKGTSGIIMGNIIVGFLSSIKDKETVTIDDVAKAFVAAKEKGYSSVNDPKEGTILTVVKDVANEAINYKGNKEDFILFLNYLKSIANESVKNSPNVFSVLKDNGVVDAGGMGFFYLLEGFEKSVSDPEMLKDLDRIVRSQAIRSARLGQVTRVPSKAKHRYDLEFLLESEKIQLDEYKKDISEYGELSYCVQIGKKIKTQINTDSPWEILKLGDSLGRVYNVNLENTTSGNVSTLNMNTSDSIVSNSLATPKEHENKKLQFTDIAIVTDSSSDLTYNHIKDLDIFIIPLKLKLKDNYYSDGIDFTRNDLWSLYRKEMSFPKASPPSANEFKELYESLFKKGYKKIISIHLSNKLSGTQQAAKVARSMLSNPKDITVIDSESLSLPLAHLVLEAAISSKSGMKYDDVIKKINEDIGKMKVFFFAEDFSFLKQNKRISFFASNFGKLFRYIPVFRLNKDKIELTDHNYGDKKTFNYIKELFENESKKGPFIFYTLWGGMNDEHLKSKVIKDLGLSVGDNGEYCGNFQLGSSIANYCGTVYGLGIINK